MIDKIANNIKHYDEGIKICHPTNLGWLEAKLPPPAMDRLWGYIEKAKDDYRSHLAGNIGTSLSINDDEHWFAHNFLERLCEVYTIEFEDGMEHFGGNCRHDYLLNSFWVNFQNQYEFNPLHKHLQAIYSFVIWMKIPTDWREQHKLPFSVNSNHPCASNFAFTFTDILGNVTDEQYFLDKSMEGTILFFPGKLQHQVYPFFNSDEQRISISGNICADTSTVRPNPPNK